MGDNSSKKREANKENEPPTKRKADVGQLQRMAQRVRNRSTTAKGLPHVLEALNQVISLRKKWSNKFIGEVTTHSNRTHDYFIDTLESILGLLRGAPGPVGCSEVPRRSKNELSRQGMTRISKNLFDVLIVEVSASPTGSPSASSAVSKTTTQTVLPELEIDCEADESDVDLELEIQILAFFEDFKEIQTQLRQAWGKYAAKTLELVSVALSTDIALEMLKREGEALQANLSKSRPKLDNYEKIVQFVMAAESLPPQ